MKARSPGRTFLAALRVESFHSMPLGRDRDGVTTEPAIKTVHCCQKRWRARVGHGEQVSLSLTLWRQILQQHAALRIDAPRLKHGLGHLAHNAQYDTRVIGGRR